MAEQQLIGVLEAGGTKMVCATGYADGTVLEREQIVTTTPRRRPSRPSTHGLPTRASPPWASAPLAVSASKGRRTVQQSHPTG